MNKSELIAAVAEKAGVAKSVADATVNAMIDAVAGALNAGDKVAIAGFGNFEVKERAAREGRNPATGEAITSLRARRSPSRRASLLKRASEFVTNTKKGPSELGPFFIVETRRVAKFLVANATFVIFAPQYMVVNFFKIVLKRRCFLRAAVLS